MSKVIIYFQNSYSLIVTD